jgi:hypothetical protein
MKTLARSIISLIMIFAGIYPGFSSNSRINPGVVKDGISYRVNIHISKDIPYCNSYLVVVSDGKNLVAPPQVYVSGIKSYSFFEPTGAPKTSGERVADLIEVPVDFNCPDQLFTTPEVLYGPFLNDATYVFDLYPRPVNGQTP